FSILGEEGIVGDQRSEFRWVVDPIDGTVNFTYGIPHTCVSIALQQRVDGNRQSAEGGASSVVRKVIGEGLRPGTGRRPDPRYQTIVGDVYFQILNYLCH